MENKKIQARQKIDKIIIDTDDPKKIKKFKKEYEKYKLIPILIAPTIVDATRGIIYKRAKLSWFEKLKIFFGIMDEPRRRRVKEKSLMEILPKVKNKGVK